jgi:hypothetical protein
MAMALSELDLQVLAASKKPAGIELPISTTIIGFDPIRAH